jgi:phosphatidate cytidylyltransferase
MIRVLSGVVLAAAALAAIFFLPPLGLRILVCAIAALAAHEYLRLVGSNDSAIGGVVIFTWVVSTGSVVTLAMVPAVVVLLAGLNALYTKFSSPVAVLGAFAIAYISVPLGLLAALHIQRGWRATVLLIATVVVSDSLQFYTGRMFGRRPLAPSISPKKTVVGAIGGAIAGTIFMVIAGPYVLPTTPPAMLALLGLTMVLLGIAGDLFESRLKREANVKDSSSLIPGHGGVLDRIDALLFVIPAFALAVGVVK